MRTAVTAVAQRLNSRPKTPANPTVPIPVRRFRRRQCVTRPIHCSRRELAKRVAGTAGTAVLGREAGAGGGLATHAISNRNRQGQDSTWANKSHQSPPVGGQEGSPAGFRTSLRRREPRSQELGLGSTNSLLFAGSPACSSCGDPAQTLLADLKFCCQIRQQEARMVQLRKGDRVQVAGGPTGRVIAVINSSLYRVRHDSPDLLGRRVADYLPEVLRSAR
jgi:hypothetical protein